MDLLDEYGRVVERRSRRYTRAGKINGFGKWIVTLPSRIRAYINRKKDERGLKRINDLATYILEIEKNRGDSL